MSFVTSAFLLYSLGAAGGGQRGIEWDPLLYIKY